MKGQPIPEIFKQIFCFLLDGTNRHLVSFDTIREGPGYPGVIVKPQEAPLSSRSVQRFFKGFSWYWI